MTSRDSSEIDAPEYVAECVHVGALGTQTLDASGVKALAELPSLETLRAQLVGLIQTPATRIAGILQAPGGQVARVLAAYAKKDEAQAA